MNIILLYDKKSNTFPVKFLGYTLLTYISVCIYLPTLTFKTQGIVYY